MASLIEDGPGGVNIPEFSVSEISGAVKRVVEGEFGHVRVRGEIGRVSRPRSGHVYLDLKDERAVLSGVVWKGVAARLEVRPEEGDEVIVTGRLTTFAGQSKYQIVIESLVHAGEGALLARLERVKKALAAEGLFAAERKRAIPWLPRVIGVVTSPSGAVIRDILHRLAERFPVRVLVWPVAVQGQACAGEVAAAIRGFNALAPGGAVPRPEVLIVARGGGSIEDLWGFNEESVARAAAGSAIPLISAVGHETDTTLIDLAADRRAPTPSAAAEMAVPVRADLAAGVAALEARRVRSLSRRLEQSRQRLRAMARALPRPASLVEARQQRLDHAAARLPRAGALVAARRQSVRLLAARLPRPGTLLQRRGERLGDLARRLPRGLRAVTQTRRASLAGTAGRLTPRLARAPLHGGRARLEGRAGRLAPALARAARAGRRDLARAADRLTPRLARQAGRRGGERLATAASRLAPALAGRTRAARDRLTGLARLLASLGHRQTLARGFALVRGPDGTVLTRAGGLAAATPVEIEFADGRVPAVTGTAPAASRRRSRPDTEGDREDQQGSLF